MSHTIMKRGNAYKQEGGHKAMSYVDEVYELVVAKNQIGRASCRERV